MPYDCNFSAVGGFSFCGGEAVKPKYGGNFLAVGGFSIFGGNDFGGGGQTITWR